MKKSKVGYLIIVFCWLGYLCNFFLAYYLYSNRANISNNGTNDTGTKLNQAVGQQLAISSGIVDCQGTIEYIGASLKRSHAADRTAADRTAADRTAAEAVGRYKSLAEESRKLAYV